MKGLLRDIVAAKKIEVKAKRKEVPLNELEPSVKPAEHGFRQALESKKHAINLIAELKKASPLSGVLREDFDVKKIASIYNRHAQAISVITDEKFFQGKAEYIKQVKEVSSLPVLRKDFVIDEYQLYESLAMGADAVLLIASIVSKQKLQKMMRLAKEIGIQALVEVHSSQDFERAFSHDLEIIGVNNRDLETMKISLNSFERIRQLIPEDRVIVAESGYSTKQHIDSIKGKADAVLMGSVLMKAEDIDAKLEELGFVG